MDAFIIITDTDFDLPSIAAAAGQSSPDKYWVERDKMFVADVTQSDLDNALAAYDHLAYIRKRKALQEISRLEQQMSPRRMREHALGIGGSWLADQDALIATERAKL